MKPYVPVYLDSTLAKERIRSGGIIRHAVNAATASATGRCDAAGGKSAIGLNSNGNDLILGLVGKYIDGLRKRRMSSSVPC